MKRFLIGVCTALLAVGALGATTASAATDHCPDHEGNPAKDESGADDNDTVLPAGQTVCVKAGDFATGLVTTDGTSSLKDLVAQAGITVGEGNVPDVSYWIVYGENGTPEPEVENPEITPTPMPETEVLSAELAPAPQPAVAAVGVAPAYAG